MFQSYIARLTKRAYNINGDIYQDNARQNTILTFPLFIKFNTFYHDDNYNA